MLIELNINNFALIQELSVEFGAGFNILSGETGAGKSILIDTIDYVLGGKFSKDQIRYGENKTIVEALFSIENEDVYDVLDEFSIERDDMLVISRETTINGKSIIKVNGRSIVLSQLKKIREKLLDIHGQHQNQNLLLVLIVEVLLVVHFQVMLLAVEEHLLPLVQYQYIFLVHHRWQHDMYYPIE